MATRILKGTQLRYTWKNVLRPWQEISIKALNCSTTHSMQLLLISFSPNYNKASQLKIDPVFLNVLNDPSTDMTSWFS